MKKEYNKPSQCILQIENSLPLMSSESGSPTIGNGFDQEGSVYQFSLDKDWSDSWD